MRRIERHRPPGQLTAAIVVAAVGADVSHPRQRVRVARIGPDGTIRRLEHARLVLHVEGGQRDHLPTFLVARIDLDGPARRSQRAAERIGQRIEEQRVLADVEVGEFGPEVRVAGMGIEVVLQGPSHFGVEAGQRMPLEHPAAEDRLTRAELLHGELPQCLHHRSRQDAGFVGDRRDDAIRDVVLDGEEVGALERLVVGVRPQVRTASGVHEVGGDSDRAGRLPCRAAEHVPRAEPLRDLAHVERAVPERGGRLGCDHRQRGEPRQPAGDVLGQTGRQRFGFGI
jgi:hypothetical protein